MAYSKTRVGEEKTLKVTQQTNSRYKRGGLSEEFNRRVGWWERKLYEHRYDDIIFTISPKYNCRPDLIAHDYLGNANLMWIVLQYNSIVDINTEFVTGKTIKIPEKSRLDKI